MNFCRKTSRFKMQRLLGASSPSSLRRCGMSLSPEPVLKGRGKRKRVLVTLCSFVTSVMSCQLYLVMRAARLPPKHGAHNSSAPVGRRRRRHICIPRTTDSTTVEGEEVHGCGGSYRGEEDLTDTVCAAKKGWAKKREMGFSDK